MINNMENALDYIEANWYEKASNGEAEYNLYNDSELSDEDRQYLNEIKKNPTFHWHEYLKQHNIITQKETANLSPIEESVMDSSEFYSTQDDWTDVPTRKKRKLNGGGSVNTGNNNSKTKNKNKNDNNNNNFNFGYGLGLSVSDDVRNNLYQSGNNNNDNNNNNNNSANRNNVNVNDNANDNDNGNVSNMSDGNDNSSDKSYDFSERGILGDTEPDSDEQQDDDVDQFENPVRVHFGFSQMY